MINKAVIPVAVFADSPLDNENKERSRKSKLRTLTVYGDSISVHYHKLATKRRLCKEIFHTCNKKYMWTYDVS